MSARELRALRRAFLRTVRADAGFAAPTGPRRVRLASGRTLHCAATATLRGFGHVSCLTADGRVLQVYASEVRS